MNPQAACAAQRGDSSSCRVTRARHDDPRPQGSRTIDSKQQKIAGLLSVEEISVQNGSLCFRDGNCLPVQTTQTGLFGRVQGLMKRRGRLYYGVVRWLSPVLPTRQYRARRSAVLAEYGPRAVVVNYGSGPHREPGREDIINADLFAFDDVDIVFDTVLPFKDESVDCFLNLAVLEHLPRPSRAVSEMYRCLKPDGTVLAYVPFMQPFHAAPHDYSRWTKRGAAELFGAFSRVEVGVGSGPTSGLLWVLQEWTSTALSFGSSTLKDLLLIGLMITTFPIKWLDFLLGWYPSADRLASGFFIHARK